MMAVLALPSHFRNMVSKWGLVLLVGKLRIMGPASSTTGCHRPRRWSGSTNSR